MHELAHVWDDASGYRLSSYLLSATGGEWDEQCGSYVPGPRAALGPTTRLGRTDPFEDFAESFAAVLSRTPYLEGKHGDIEQTRRLTMMKLFRLEPSSRSIDNREDPVER